MHICPAGVQKCKKKANYLISSIKHILRGVPQKFYRTDFSPPVLCCAMFHYHREICMHIEYEYEYEYECQCMCACVCICCMLNILQCALICMPVQYSLNIILKQLTECSCYCCYSSNRDRERPREVENKRRKLFNGTCTCIHF